MYGEEIDYGEEDGEFEENGNRYPGLMRPGGGYKQFPQQQRIPVEAEYLSNPSDIIDEEECEESEEEKEKDMNMKKQSKDTYEEKVKEQVVMA